MTTRSERLSRLTIGFTALLGLGGWAVPAPTSASAGGALEVAATAPVGAADESSLPVASFSEEIQVVGQAPVIETRTLTGCGTRVVHRLRMAFENSRLTILATVGESRWLELREDGNGQVVTELRIQEVLKGTVDRRFRPPFRSVFYLHHEFVGEGDEGLKIGSLVPEPPGPKPGITTLAFLDPSTDRQRLSGLPVYELGGGRYELDELTAPEVTAYRKRIHALTAILGPEGILPADLAEWLVATAEEPLTREEVFGELNDDSMVRQLTETQRQRLLLSLLSTDRLTSGDVALYELVHDELLDEADTQDAAAIRLWLRRQLARHVAEAPETPWSWFGFWADVAERLGESALQERAKEAQAAIEAFYEQTLGDDTSDAAVEEKRMVELARPLSEQHRRRLAELLASD